MAASSSPPPPPDLEYKECCPRVYGPYLPSPPPPPPPPRRTDDNVTETETDDEGVSDDEDVCFCIPFPWLLDYHREQMGNPDLTEDQLWKHFREANKAILEEEDDEDFNIDDWAPEWSEESSRCYSAAKGKQHPDYQNRCIVTGLSKDTTIEELDELFSRAGNIVESKILKDKKTGESMGYGFVSFEYHKCMFDAIQILNGHVLKGQTLTVFRCQNSGYPGTKDRSRDDVPPCTKDNDGPPRIKDSKDDGGAADGEGWSSGGPRSSGRRRIDDKGDYVYVGSGTGDSSGAADGCVNLCDDDV